MKFYRKGFTVYDYADNEEIISFRNISGSLESLIRFNDDLSQNSLNLFSEEAYEKLEDRNLSEIYLNYDITPEFSYRYNEYEWEWDEEEIIDRTAQFYGIGRGEASERYQRFDYPIHSFLYFEYDCDMILEFESECYDNYNNDDLGMGLIRDEMLSHLDSYANQIYRYIIEVFQDEGLLDKNNRNIVTIPNLIAI